MATQMTTPETRAMARGERTRDREVLVPRVDIYETADEIVLTADMPGVDEKAVDVTLEQDVLTIEGRAQPPQMEGYSLLLGESTPGDYRRVFTLATDIDRDKISAEVSAGVLKLRLPKAEPAKAKKIVVQGH